jgi:hypothetical protein
MATTLRRPARHSRSRIARILRWLGLALAWLVVAGLMGWSVAALDIDLPVPWLRLPAAIIFAIAALAVLILVRGAARKLLTCLLGFAVVLAWWLSIAPSTTGTGRPMSIAPHGGDRGRPRDDS